MQRTHPYHTPSNGEKRRYSRLPLRFPLRFRLVNAINSRFKESQVSDFSEGGLRFVNDDFIPHRESILIELFDPLKKKPVYVVSQVVRSKQRPSGHAYDIGVKFSRVLLEEKESFKSYLSSS